MLNRWQQQQLQQLKAEVLAEILLQQPTTPLSIQQINHASAKHVASALLVASCSPSIRQSAHTCRSCDQACLASQAVAAPAPQQQQQLAAAAANGGAAAQPSSSGSNAAKKSSKRSVNMTEKFYATRQDIYDCFTVQVGQAVWDACEGMPLNVLQPMPIAVQQQCLRKVQQSMQCWHCQGSVADGHLRAPCRVRKGDVTWFGAQT